MRQIIFFTLLVNISCKSHTVKFKTNSPLKDTSAKPISIHSGNYFITKRNIVAFAKNRNAINEIGKLRSSFIAIVCDSIIPYWIGTKWDFNGITRIPQKGSIACGYFITTVLQDAGVVLDRSILAQSASEQMIKKLVSKKYIHRYSNKSQADFITGIRQTGKGLYIVGLDNHTGFIYYADDGIWFIHSTYVNPGGVVKQDAVDNAILHYSKYRVTGKLSDDESFLKRWYRNLLL